MAIADSGNRTEYSTGAVRDIKEGKGRCDLMPLDIANEMLCDKSAVLHYINTFWMNGDRKFLLMAIDAFWEEDTASDIDDSMRFTELLDVSKHFEEGAEKYGENNWQKGIPVHSYIDSALRHYFKCRMGMTDERHDRAFVWNLMCCAWTVKHMPEMDDFTNCRKENTNG